MNEVTEIEGNVTNVTEDSEPWTFYTTITEKLVTGWLADAVRAKVGMPEGVVTSLEDSTSSGTCELCGGESETIKLFVNGVEVYSGEDYTDLSGTPNPFLALNAWLNGKEAS